MVEYILSDTLGILILPQKSGHLFIVLTMHSIALGALVEPLSNQRSFLLFLFREIPLFLDVALYPKFHCNSYYLLIETQAEPDRTIQSLEPPIVVSDLSICQAYWVTTSAVNCVSRLTSNVALIDVHDPSQFNATINLGNNGPCSTWITTEIDQKRRDVQDFVLEALTSACSYSVPCTGNTTFLCQADDNSKVTLAYVL